MVSVIAACTSDYIIGVNGVIPWRAPVDLRRFKMLTKGCSVIMGRTTWMTLPGPLVDRHNIILTRDPEYAETLRKRAPSPTRVSVCSSLTEALTLAKQERTWICGGGEVYREALLTDVVDFIDLTVVDAPCSKSMDPEATLRITYFPFDIMQENFYSKESPVTNPEDPRLKHTLYERW